MRLQDDHSWWDATKDCSRQFDPMRLQHVCTTHNNIFAVSENQSCGLPWPVARCGYIISHPTEHAVHFVTILLQLQTGMSNFDPMRLQQVWTTHNNIFAVSENQTHASCGLP